MNEAEALAADFHRALAFGHAVALWFNWRRRNWRWVAFHGFCYVMDSRAAREHAKDVTPSK